MERCEGQRLRLGGRPGRRGGGTGDRTQGASPGERHHLSPDFLWAAPHPDSFQGRALAFPAGLQSQAGVVVRGPFPSPLDTERGLPASNAFYWTHLPVSVFMFSSLTMAVWSTSLRKYLLLKVVAITTTSLHARPSISEMQNLSLKACAAHQRGIGAHYFYIILQANRYFPIHISFLS